MFPMGIYSYFVRSRVKNKLMMVLKINEKKQPCSKHRDINFKCALAMITQAYMQARPVKQK